jgi:DNA polymerase III epsilon subunit family exonuclease
MIYTEHILQSLPCYAINRSGTRHKRNYGKDIEGFRCTSLTSRTPIRKLRTFIAFDTETTGLNLSDDVIEVAAVRFDDFMPKLVFSTLIKPRKPIPAQASAVNHITDSMVADAPMFYELIPSFEFVFRDYPLVAHHAPFDVKMMYVNGFDAIKEKKVYDTCAISNRLYPAMQNHKLGTVCNAHGIINGNAHRAASDALSCGLLFVQFLMVRFNCNNTDELRAKLKQ